MKQPLMLLVIGLFFGGGIGFVMAAANDVTLTGHDHADHAAHVDHAETAMDIAGHDHHAARDISADGTPPGVTLRLHPDEGDAINLEIVTTGFRFAPDHVNGAHVAGEGHAHVYVDGVKVARAYGPWIHLTGLAPGAEIRVTLNANSHEELALGSDPIAAVATVP